MRRREVFSHGGYVGGEATRGVLPTMPPYLHTLVYTTLCTRVHHATPMVYTAALVLHGNVYVRMDNTLGSRREYSLGGSLKEEK